MRSLSKSVASDLLPIKGSSATWFFFRVVFCFFLLNGSFFCFSQEIHEKASSPDPGRENRITAQNFLRIRFINTISLQTDENILRVHPLATEGFDNNLEAYKLDGAGLNMAMLVGEDRLAIQAIPFLGDLRLVPLEVKSPSSGQYLFEFENLDTFLGPSHEMFIRDNFMGTFEPVESGNSIQFQISQDLGSQGKYRFELIIKRIETPTALQPFLSNPYSVYPNPSGAYNQTVTISGLSDQPTRLLITDLKGSVLFDREMNPLLGKLKIPVSPHPGLYIVWVESGRRSQKIKWLVE